MAQMEGTHLSGNTASLKNRHSEGYIKKQGLTMVGPHVSLEENSKNTQLWDVLSARDLNEDIHTIIGKQASHSVMQDFIVLQVALSHT